jgi:hypothetical protein
MSVVEAEQFLLVDSNGVLQAGLFATPNGPTMQFYDTNKHLRVAIGLAPGAASVQLYDADGRMRATIAAFDSGDPIVQLYDTMASVMKLS